MDREEFTRKGLLSTEYTDGIIGTLTTQGPRRVLRGGSWRFDGRRCRSSCRYARDPGSSRAYVGFRLVLAPVQSKKRKPKA